MSEMDAQSLLTPTLLMQSAAKLVSVRDELARLGYLNLADAAAQLSGRVGLEAERVQARLDRNSDRV